MCFYVFSVYFFKINEEVCVYFDRITILIDYLFIYLDHTKVKDKLKKKRITLVPVKFMFFYLF